MKKICITFLAVIALLLTSCYRVSAVSSVAITISAVGDCTLGTDPHFSYKNTFNDYYKRKGVSYFLKNVKDIFKEDDLTIANLENVLTTRTSRANKKWAYKGNPSYINIFKKNGVEAVSFANNHCRDFGAKSYDDTIKTLKDAKMAYASYQKVATYTVKGKKIGMVAVSNFYGSPKSDMKKAVDKLKKKKVDILIVSIHAGGQHVYKETSLQKSLGHYAVDLGADLVLEHHPHWIQGFEKYKGVYIAYSLGNFCYGGAKRCKDQDTFILQKTFKFDHGVLKKDKSLKIIPCSISSISSRNNYQPTVLKGKNKTRLINKVNKMSKKYKVSFQSNGCLK